MSSLYLSQGLPFGFFTQALPALLREMQLSLPAIGATSLLALPWALKFLWAPLVDRHWLPSLGRRRSWILPLQGLTALMMVLVALLDPEQGLTLVLASFLLANLLAATQDVATDGLAVELLRKEERGLGNGVQVAGYRVGMILGGGALLIAYDAIGWSGSFLAMALVLVLATVPVALFPEQKIPAGESPETIESTGRILKSFVSRPGMLGWLAFLAAYKFGEALGGGMLRPMLVDKGLALSDIGWLLGTAGFTAGLLGAVLGGWLTGRIGRYPALVGFGVLQALTVGAFGAIALLDPAQLQERMPLLYGVVIIEHLVGGMATAALFTLMMDATRKVAAGTEYTIQASVVVIATGTASALSGVSAQAFGYALHWGLAAALCLMALVPLGIAALTGGFSAVRAHDHS